MIADPDACSTSAEGSEDGNCRDVPNRFDVGRSGSMTAARKGTTRFGMLIRVVL
jgi:hypothetical protein